MPQLLDHHLSSTHRYANDSFDNRQQLTLSSIPEYSSISVDNRQAAIINNRSDSFVQQNETLSTNQPVAVVQIDPWEEQLRIREATRQKNRQTQIDTVCLNSLL
jgi:hypothetical protein